MIIKDTSITTLLLQKKSQYNEIGTNQKNHQQVTEFSPATHSFVHEVNLSYLPNEQYQKLSENISGVTKAHSAFLQARQKSLQQISEMIQVQVALSQQLFNQLED